jgi:hypothetical protein
MNPKNMFHHPGEYMQEGFLESGFTTSHFFIPFYIFIVRRTVPMTLSFGEKENRTCSFFKEDGIAIS